MAAVVDRVVRACAEVAVLATSREGLGVSGERIVAVGSLGLPAQDASGDVARAADAVQLFVARANDARSDFVLSDENLAAVVQICRRLDGIALAVVLAAARVQSMTPSEIAARLADQFQLLRGSLAVVWNATRPFATRSTGRMTCSPMQSAWSSIVSRCLLAAPYSKTPKRSSWTTHLAASDVLEHLSALVRRSLVSAEMADGHTRYRLLETVRQYAHDRLDQSDSVAILQRRHAEHFACLAQDAGPHLRGPDQLEWLGRLSPEIDNLRAAQSWAIDHGDLDLALAVVVPLCVNGTAIGYTAFEWAGALAMEPGVELRPLGSTLLARAAFRAAIAGDFELAMTLDARRSTSEATLGIEPSFGSYEATFAIRCSPQTLQAHSTCAVDASKSHATPAMTTTSSRHSHHSVPVCPSRARWTTQSRSCGPASLKRATSLTHPPSPWPSQCWACTSSKSIRPSRSASSKKPSTSGPRSATNSRSRSQAAPWLASTRASAISARRVHTYLATLDSYPVGQYHHSAIPMFIGIASWLVASGHDETAAVLQGASDAVMQPEVPVSSATATNDHNVAATPRRRRAPSLLARGAAMAFDDIIPYARASLEAIQTYPDG